MQTSVHVPHILQTMCSCKQTIRFTSKETSSVVPSPSFIRTQRTCFNEVPSFSSFSCTCTFAAEQVHSSNKNVIVAAESSRTNHIMRILISVVCDIVAVAKNLTTKARRFSLTV